ncbi:MAG: riboflavin synthase [Nitrosopumilus sp. H8]|nr:MAG: riboflavin synthase [Nitrosopumilus sp. H8]
MFTGIIQGMGRVKGISRNTKDKSAFLLQVDLGAHARGLKSGQSVALNGVCLTAVRISKQTCTFEMIQETARLTSLGGLRTGQTVNIERSLKAGDRLEGHFVLGHVDGTATITKILKLSKEVRMWFRFPKKLEPYVVKKGSIALDGTSLTITAIKSNTASVSLIPHTLKNTNLCAKKTGDLLNIETDILGKYIQRNLPK